MLLTELLGLKSICLLESMKGIVLADGPTTSLILRESVHLQTRSHLYKMSRVANDSIDTLASQACSVPATALIK
jgi:hypothetical protein